MLREEDLRWAYSGIRAKVNKRSGEEDFSISFDSHAPTFINLIGIESPGFAAAFAIAEYIEKEIRSRGIA